MTIAFATGFVFGVCLTVAAVAVMARNCWGKK